jgi:hypothetical protein
MVLDQSRTLRMISSWAWMSLNNQIWGYQSHLNNLIYLQKCTKMDIRSFKKAKIMNIKINQKMRRAKRLILIFFKVIH